MIARRKRDHSPEQLLTDIHEALVDAENFVLPLDVDEFMDDRKARGLARDALNRIRTAVLALDGKDLKAMPEFVAGEIAELRNIAVYDYGMDADELVYRTLCNSVPKWRVGIDRVRHGTGPDGELPTRLVTSEHLLDRGPCGQQVLAVSVLQRLAGSRPSASRRTPTWT